MTNPSPAQRLGQRLTPGRFETLPLCLLSGAIVFAAWSERTWILACLAALCLLSLITAVISGIAGRGYRRRRGAIAHQRFDSSGRLGWGVGVMILAWIVVLIWLPTFLDLRDRPLWLRAGAAIALVVIGWISAQAYLRARARVAGSPEGALPTTPTSSSAPFSDPLDLAIADLLSRTQMMRVDALTEDLAMPGDQLRARLEDLLTRGVIERDRNHDGSVDDHHWVHLTFHGERQLAAALQSASTDTV